VFKITDHSGCVEFHPACLASATRITFGIGLLPAYDAQDSANVHLKTQHSRLAHTGIWAGRLTDWTVEMCASPETVGPAGMATSARAARTRHVDLSALDSGSGTGVARPGLDSSHRVLGARGWRIRRRRGTATTGGRWVIEDSAIRHNTQDGLDLLYARLLTSTIRFAARLQRETPATRSK